MRLPHLAFLLAAALTCACADTQSARSDEAKSAAPIRYAVVQADARVRVSDVADRSWSRDHSILLRTLGNVWYHGVLAGGCMNKGWSAIGFDPATADYIDRGSSVVLGRERCRIVSFDQIEPAPDARE